MPALRGDGFLQVGEEVDGFVDGFGVAEQEIELGKEDFGVLLVDPGQPRLVGAAVGGKHLGGALAGFNGLVERDAGVDVGIVLRRGSFWDVGTPGSSFEKEVDEPDLDGTHVAIGNVGVEEGLELGGGQVRAGVMGVGGTAGDVQGEGQLLSRKNSAVVKLGKRFADLRHVNLLKFVFHAKLRFRFRARREDFRDIVFHE